MQPLFLVKLAGIPLFTFTTLVAAGFAAALIGGLPAWRRAGYTLGDALTIAAWMLALALVGGRIAHILYNLDYFRERPIQLVWFADGGLAFAGVAAGALLGLGLWCRRRGCAPRIALDLIAWPALVMASFAWLGAFMHGSQYGAPTESALGLELRDNYGVILSRWPAPLWAAGWSALCALGMAIARRRVMAPGLFAMLTCVLYSGGIFLIDFARGDPSIYIWGLRLTQWLYLVACAALILSIGRISKPA